MLRPFGLVSALLALVLALPSTALAQSTDRSVVFTSDPSQAMVMDRATGLWPLIEAASGVLPLAEDGLAVARERLRGVAQLLAQARQRQVEAAAALVRANRLVADTVQEADRLRNTYDDALAGLSDSSRRKLERDAHTRSNRSAVVRLATSPDWVCPVGERIKFRDSWGERRSGGRQHEGVDLVGLRHDPILAPVDGVVIRRWDTLGGRSFDLVAANGDYYFGTHMGRFGADGEVRAGEVIGYMGDGGNAKGVPLHFEYHPGGGHNPVNPYPIVDAQCTDRADIDVSLYD